MKILSMVGDGKITAEEAAVWIDAVSAGGIGGGTGSAGGNSGAERPGGASGATSGGGATMIHVRVTESSSGDTRVNFSLPLGMARFVSNMVPRGKLDQMNDYGIDLDAALDAIDTGSTGVIVDTEVQNGHHIRLWLE